MDQTSIWLPVKRYEDIDGDYDFDQAGGKSGPHPFLSLWEVCLLWKDESNSPPTSAATIILIPPTASGLQEGG